MHAVTKERMSIEEIKTTATDRSTEILLRGQQRKEAAAGGLLEERRVSTLFAWKHCMVMATIEQKEKNQRCVRKRGQRHFRVLEERGDGTQGSRWVLKRNRANHPP